MAKGKKETAIPSINSINSSINVHKIENGFLGYWDGVWIIEDLRPGLKEGVKSCHHTLNM